jgi:adenylate kinase
MELVLIGNTGSGKTTVARKLAESLDFPHVGSGDIAREISENDPEVRRGLERGLDAPEQIIRDTVRERIEQAQLTKGGFILEGFPRRIDQLVALSIWLPAPPQFIFLDCPAYTCIKRLARRGRHDDTPDGIARKLESFHDKCRPMMRVLEQSGSLWRFPADDFDNPHDQILRALS